MVAPKRRKTSSVSTMSKDSESPAPSKMDKRRYDCMMNQRRYRERKKSKTQNTEWYVDELRRETRRLEEHAALLKSNMLMRNIQAGTFRCRSISTYLNLFRSGLARVPGHLLNQQLDIIDSLMHPNVVLNGSVGVHGLRQQWEAFNEYFSQINMKVLDMQTLGDDHAVVVVDAVLELLFDRHTISCLFPNAVDRDNLVAAVLDKVIACPLRLSFVFGDNQVESTEAHLSFVEGLHNVLGNLHDTMLFVHGDDATRITPEGMIAVEAVLLTQLSSRAHEMISTPIKFDMLKPTLAPLKSEMNYILM
ncbi:hypothetical protein SPRG_01996 [Saprolegnia parasitica CBS 223.65]|uniref:BZIP domain-containing protein n=1 Tax=Saprolegnia parasitica (strain CBS 223.65) TaxID=695850 RepID=A0A067CR92_SAPPC|nr:hypothetical protein SPRG_01996 [Saprolegnia parasitica CBS 223.65]KDO33184.1 hypothetical protein SPRG_01996 [Saprolegnia parasitica CBS 223.65]|eukprot:XP_012195945.1 hypothetical protein SPRG_01996 [Saprolegnia parasitica CBS 223.65]